MLKYYNVFHVETQTVGLKPKARGAHDMVMVPDGKTKLEQEWDAIEEADAIVRAYLERSGVAHTEVIGDRAFYRPSTDSIQTPTKAQFKDPAEYYSTLFHEITHSTGHQTRLDRFRETGSHAFGSENYSKEELVAELGASALVNFLGLETKSSFRNTAAYIQSWASRLREDTKLIVSASGKAEKAINYILTGELPAKA
jgi:antirestriction protein ArdC